MTKTIPLTRGKVAIVDDEDYEWLMQRKWNCHKNGYACRTQELESVNWKRKQVVIKMHRLIMEAKIGQMVDHINGDILDNRKENLRFATTSQNSWNCKIKNRIGRTSKYKGVSWRKRDSKWQVAIMVYRKRKWLGAFEKEDDAALAYNIAAIKYHGEYARLNDLAKWREGK